MDERMPATIRVVHLDPGGFDDVEIERRAFRDAFPGVAFDMLAASERHSVADAGHAEVLLTHYSQVDAAAMDAVRPEVIVRYATGVDGVDVDAATERGIRVVRIPEYCDAEVGEHVLALALALWRRLPHFAAHTSRGGWDWRAAAPGGRLADAAFGFLGFGRKARAAADLAAGLGCRLLAHDPHLPEADIAARAQPVAFDDLFRRADIVSLHPPLTRETEGIVGARTLGLMRAGAVLINTARGRIVDEAALAAALDHGPLAGAGLDVLAEEPPRPDHPLLGRDDVIVTPHAAWYSRAAEQRCRELGSRYAVEALRGEACAGLVNPEVLGRR